MNRCLADNECHGIRRGTRIPTIGPYSRGSVSSVTKALGGEQLPEQITNILKTEVGNAERYYPPDAPDGMAFTALNSIQVRFRPAFAASSRTWTPRGAVSVCIPGLPRQCSTLCQRRPPVVAPQTRGRRNTMQQRNGTAEVSRSGT